MMTRTRLSHLSGCAAAVLLAVAAGCERRDQIEHYTVLKPPPIENRSVDAAGMAPTPSAPTDRTLAAIVPVGSQGWFFKLTGPMAAVATQQDAFMALLKSVRFNDDGKPQWTLPEGWQQRPGSDIRYATLVIGDGEKPLELSVTVLPKSGDDDSDYALVNINRWRGQLKLPPIGKAELASESVEVPLEGATATVVNLVGTATAGGMGRGPFFPGAGDGK